MRCGNMNEFYGGIFNLPWVIELYLMTHSEDNGKFKVGEKVRLIAPKFGEFCGKEFVILASNVQDEDATEYLLEGLPFLAWEEELEKI